MILSAPTLAQISPGPLSRAHQSISGPLQCTSCHKLAAGSAIYACLDCHTEIAQRLSSRRGFHASVVKPTDTSRDCIACHSEHNGDNFSLIHWDPSRRAFDHRKTGYVLEGKHAEIACQQCHNARNISPVERASIKIRDPNRTFLGLSRDCLSCHEDRHRGQLGKNCLECHTLTDWKTPSGFNHAKTRFPLRGAHVRVTCQKCHKPSSRDEMVLKYTGLAFDKCSACHADPHRDAFKTDCEPCHSTITWRQVSLPALNARFDHAKTEFPLTGKHSDVRCSSCHHGQAFSVPLAHEKCAVCHEPDPHSGQFRARKDGGACDACHTVEGFKAVKFGLAEHAATSYPLEGRHAAVACGKCHKPAGMDTVYKLKHDLCTGCHQDVHQGQFSGPPHGNRCEACHTVNGFAPSTFSLARHEKAQFRLVGSHVAVACIDCHQAKKLPGTGQPVPYHFADLTCTSCHDDPHRGQFADRMSQAASNSTWLGCEVCHTTKRWAEIERFDHDTTKFPLIGSHRAVPCIGCHKPPNLELTMKNVVFNSAPTRCEGCHEDIHAGQFTRNGVNPDCAECHNTFKWKPSLFDHEIGTTFPLRGAHQDVRCTACHNTTREVQGRMVLYYKPTPAECASCHGPTGPT